MARLTLIATLRLVPTDAGGRRSPILSDDRPTFDLGVSWKGNPAMTDGRILLLDGNELAPGAEGLVRIEPTSPELWAAVRKGAVLPLHEGTRVVGHVTVEDVAFAGAFTAVIATYVWKARELCSFIEEAGKIPLGERMSKARHYLLAVYAAALSLGCVEATDDAAPADSVEPPSDWQGFEQFETYWEVFDPYALEEPVAASLSDDLLDVYRDMRRGLALWDSVRDASAIFEWRLSFESHWGEHAVDALRALHRACRRGVR